MTGRATLTTEPSIKAMLDARMVATSTQTPTRGAQGVASGAERITPSSQGDFTKVAMCCALSRSRNGPMSFLVVPERMPLCFPLYIVSSLWKVPEKATPLILLITKTDGVPVNFLYG